MFSGQLQRPQPRVCKLSRSVFGLGLRWPENTACVFLGKNERCVIGHGEQTGRQVLRVMGTWAASRFIPRAVSGGRTAWGETGKFFEPRQRPQPIVYGLSRNVLGLWLGWLENMPPVLLGKNEGCGIGRAEQIGQQVVPGNRYLGCVALNTHCCSWPVGGLGAGTLHPAPTSPRSFSRQASSGTQTSGMPLVLVSPKDLL